MTDEFPVVSDDRIGAHMPYESSVWQEVFYGVREPGGGYGVAPDVIDIDGASTPVVYETGLTRPANGGTRS